MAILVVCRSCHKRFKVSEKFAGKKGPCPNCKEIITIPGADEKVEIHAPEHSEAGARSVTGELVLKPVSREDHSYPLSKILLISGVALGVLLFALGLRFLDSSALRYIFGALGAVALAPPLVLGGYYFLRNDELEAYEGQSLTIRVGVCAAVYAVTWAIFSLIPPEFTNELYQWFYLGPIFAAIGMTASFCCFDLDLTSAFFHYAFYVMITGLLAVAMGVPLLAA